MTKARDLADLSNTATTTLDDADIGVTVLAPDGDGSQLTGIDALPTQTGNSGKYLTTDGSVASWDTVAAPDRGYTLINTYTPTSATEIVIDLAGYDNYLIVVDDMTISTTNNLFGQCSTDGGSTYVTNSEYSFYTSTSYNTGGSFNAKGYFNLGNELQTTANHGFSCITIDNIKPNNSSTPLAATFNQLVVTNQGYLRSSDGWFGTFGDHAINAIKLYNYNNYALTANAIYVYGYND